MKIGMIGLGVVGGTLEHWFRDMTEHELRLLDPPRGLNDDLSQSEAIFISVPVPAADGGQDLTTLIKCVNLAKKITPFVFIRSTVLPGTNDSLGTISMPEFLTARKARQDMSNLPILSGSCPTAILREIFPSKKLIIMSNAEAELAKMAHNCFGAMKVNYFNIIHNIAKKTGADYEMVLQGIGLTGFIEKQHTQVPGPDGRYGYGGSCFPQNMRAMEEWLDVIGMGQEAELFYLTSEMNDTHREAETMQFEYEAEA